MIAALYVQKNGCYFGLPGVDPWDARRDARRYPGPFPVVAHPPCARWCAFAPMAEQRHAAKAQAVIPGMEYGTKVGEDAGCFAAALAAVRRWGGVLEHPKGSRAWPTHGLTAPPREGWGRSGKGWVCEVSQGHYGHRADKLTWLYYEGSAAPPDLVWGVPDRPDGPWSLCSHGCGDWWCSVHQMHAHECPCPPVEEWTSSPYAAERTATGLRRGSVETMTHAERAATPLAFRDLLIEIALASRPALKEET